MVCGHMKRATPIRILLASCLLTATASVAHAQSTTPGGVPPPPGMSLRNPLPCDFRNLFGLAIFSAERFSDPSRAKTFSVGFVDLFVTAMARSWSW